MTESLIPCCTRLPSRGVIVRLGERIKILVTLVYGILH